MSYVEKLAKSIEQIAKSIEQRIKASMHKTNWYAFCSCFYTIKRSKFMKKYWNPKSRMIHNPACLSLRSLLYALCYQLGLNSFKLLALSSVLSALLIFCWLLYPERASSGPYLDSAHGSSSYGVKRSATGFPTDYGQGNCAHCHEQHASIGGAEPDPTGGPDKYELMSKNFNTSKTTNLYAQSDSVCFYCHIVTGTYQSPVFYNYTYSITFGGNPDTTPNNIFDTFNSTSYHNLYDIWRLITGLYGSKTFTSFPADSNPCSGCHNIHIAQRSCGKPAGSYDPTKSAISKPSDHSNLWGDGDNERMDDYTANYQPPRYYNSTNLEPDNASSDRATQAAKTPDYATFCTDCHTSTSNSVWSTTLNRWLRPIDWSIEKHGKGSADGAVSLNSPYSSTLDNKVLSCLDCHEPHGSPNVTLIRKEVNGGTLGGTVTTIAQTDCSFPWRRRRRPHNENKEIAYLCDRCHKDDYEFTTSCYENHYYKIHHDSASGDPFYTGGSCGSCHSGGGSGCTSSRNTQNCNCCHYHGSTDQSGETTRRTF